MYHHFVVTLKVFTAFCKIHCIICSNLYANKITFRYNGDRLSVGLDPVRPYTPQQWQEPHLEGYRVDDLLGKFLLPKGNF